MSGVELGLGIIGAVAAIDVAIKACRRVAETCSTLKHAETEIYERSTRLRSNCVQMETQLKIFRQIANQLDEQGQIVQTDVFEILSQKLDYADAKLKGLIKSRSGDPDATTRYKKSLSKKERTNYAIQKDSLDKAIKEVESWQGLSFNPLWFAIMKYQSQHFDEELDRAKENNQHQGHKMIAVTIGVRNLPRDTRSAHVFLPPEKLESAKIVKIAFSSVKSVQVDNKWRILDSISDSSEDTVRELAVRLKSANPSTFGLLTCLAAVHEEKNNEFSLVFRKPDSMSEPETLRAAIMASDKTHSLSDRFRLATQLARAVSSVHTFDMVHKNIRPENIILFRDSESTLGSAFLLGFETIRREQDGTRLRGDIDWVKNLYWHPRRQGSRIQDRYIMQHDIYSLGVCLLEIGLWSSFVEYTPNQSPTRSHTYELCAESSNEFGHPELVKSRLLSLATKELPRNMGTKYAKIVESCLTCLDLGNEDFGEESELQEDGVTVAVRYIEKVLMQLSDISV
ncbi:hypothetical protein DM02DRAFT_619642 [Periconia macrospinosa]|uniref:Protein kinase domain-containing protein n=1 Tax=Periconia macrospinosa TaxID=97972 RepID=A0A2V1D4C9_9PLEO|nr:hypothetical protein DM02DRAFT_619642 [Periconia macrospinosa]